MSNFLETYWEEFIEYKPTQEEKDNLPFRLAPGKWKSYNSADENLLFIGNFLKKRRPISVLECGTFEGRGTEYLIRVMCKESPEGRTLMSLDVEEEIDHIDRDTVTFFPKGHDEDFLSVKEIRDARLTLFKHVESIDFRYYKGLTRNLLGKTIPLDNVDFIYQDASHLISLLKQEWEIIESLPKKDGLIICFDDMKDHEFVDWFKTNVKDWCSFYLPDERGQLWVEPKEKEA